MLDITYIREHADAVRKGAAARRINFDLDRLLALDREVRPLQAEWEQLQSAAQRAVEDDRQESRPASATP